jgi:hypothetical protein
MVKKMEACVSIKVESLLSQCGILFLLKSVIKRILVYWTPIAAVSKGIFHEICKACVQFL